MPAQFPTIEFQGGKVGLEVKSLGGDFSQFVTQLTDAGMQITGTNPAYAIVDGYAPVNELPTIAELPQTMAGEPRYYPIAYATELSGRSLQRSPDVDVRRHGALGVQRRRHGPNDWRALHQRQPVHTAGSPASYATGDLSSTNPVNVIQDNPNTPTDEGRAMLENIHDIAPGANLQFATATISESQFGANIQALQKAGSNIIVDDVGYADEPMFQDGIIAQAVNTVTQAGATYFSAAGNEGPDSGYLSQFRSSSGTITGIGSGTFMNFNPNGGTNIELPITTGVANALITFQFDQPYQFQEPTGSSGKVTSNVNIYVIDASTGTVVVGAAANQNNVAAQQPWQFIEIPTAGSYYVAVQVVSGSNPGHIEFSGFNDTNGAVTVSTQYGSAGNTSYPSSFGHATAANTIGNRRDPLVGPRSVSRADAPCQRAFQLERPRALRVQLERRSALHAGHRR